MHSLSVSKKALVTTAIVTGVLVIIGIAFVLYSRASTTEYRGYERGFCPPNKFEAWSGGNPTGNRYQDNECYTRNQIDRREKDIQEGKSF